MDKTYDYIKTKKHKQFVHLILDRKEKKNALNPKMIYEIQDVFDTYKMNQNIRIILISSNSDVFCAGADVEYLQKIKNFSHTENLNDSKLLMQLFKTMLTYPKLIISQVSGYAIGGGCGLITAIPSLSFKVSSSRLLSPSASISSGPSRCFVSCCTKPAVWE